MAKYLYHAVVHAGRHQGRPQGRRDRPAKAVDALAKSLGGSVEVDVLGVRQRRLLRDRRPAQRGRRRGPRGDHGRVRRRSRSARSCCSRPRTSTRPPSCIPTTGRPARSQCRALASAGRPPGTRGDARDGAGPGAAPALHSAAMDLHVIGPLASPAERAAVDAVLGPPESRLGRRPAGTPRSRATPRTRRPRDPGPARSQLLPALHAVQARVGWISQPALNYISRRLAVPPAEAYGVATFYALFATKPRPPVVAHVCDDIACRIAGARDDLRGPDAVARARPVSRPATGGSAGCDRRASGCATWRRRR